MLSFVVGQMFHRRTRSILTIFGVALGVVLVTLTVGLARGQLAERGRREASTGAEILVRPPGSGLSPVQGTLSIDLNTADQIRKLPGVAAVVPLGQQVERTEAGFGWRSIDGVEFDEYAALSNLQMVEGRAFTPGAAEAVVDQVYARERGDVLGTTIDFGGRPFTIVGIYSPESMSRIKIPLAAMQEYFNAYGSASLLMVKVREGASDVEVARALREVLPDNQIILSRDLPAFYSQGLPALRTFLNVVVGLSVLISTLVILLTMYTTVVERTRQIGILKSLGASRAYIAAIIESEAVAISVIGVIVGFAIAVVSAAAIRRATPLQIEFEAWWFFVTGAVGIMSGALGALYPALRAATLDPVDALSHD